MKSGFVLAASFVLLLSGVLSAATLSENFNSVADGEYPTDGDWYYECSGDYGWPDVTPSTGTGDPASKGLANGSNLTFRTAVSHNFDATTQTKIAISADFYYEGGSKGGFFGMGLVDNTIDTPNNLTPYSSGGAGRAMIGVRHDTDETLGALARGGTVGNMYNAYSGAPTFTLTAGHWYRFSTEISVDENVGDYGTVYFSEISLYDIGTDGTATPTALTTGQSTSLTLTESLGGGMDLENLGLGYIGNRDRGVQTIDNIAVEFVPEPATMGLLAMGGLAMLRRRRR